LYAYPNPTSTDTQIWLETTLVGNYRVRLGDVMGRTTTTIQEGLLATGKQAFMVPLASLAPGAYLVSVEGPQGIRKSLRVVRMP
jgi:hypothetical protein